ncbi:uncharacterized protein LOC101862721 [Aplysia californica]|uniref:Uncharacterized protein LOC101862721 n=1 Tax=Aplysia californica TaxID=6500 RepID=A0ABM0JKW6_APLCA|nr:uncharacterized protein LOC101862721 [Aplysia californica]
MSWKLFLFVTAVFCLLSTTAGQLGVQQWTRPSVVQESLTKTLTVNCSIVADVNSSVSQAITLYIYKSTMREPSVFADVAYISGIEDKVEPAFSLNATLTGHLSLDGKDSYLALRWDYPQFELTGSFKCELMGLTSNMHVTKVQVVSQVTDARPDLQAALLAIERHDVRIGILETALVTLSARLDRFKDSMFYTTLTNNGRQYLVSRPFLQNSAMAESACKIYGGYLVEFDLQEFIIVKQVLANASVSDPVLVGITDEIAEGVWRFREHPLLSPSYTLWERNPQQPDGGRAENCARLERGALGEWWLTDVPCYDNAAGVRFMCEVPVEV